MKKAVRAWGDVTSWAEWSTWLYREVAPFVANHFDAGGLIAARLSQACTLVARSYVAANVAAALQLMQTLPAVWVVPGDDDAIAQDDPHGVAQFFDQAWLVLVGVRNVQSAEYGEAALDEAGMIVTQVLEALQGWQPSPDHGPLRRIKARRPLAYEKGTALVPLQFVTRIYREGSVNADPT